PYGDEFEEEQEPPRTDWDPRWANLLLPHVGGPLQQRVVLALAVVMGDKVVPHLLKRLDLRSAAKKYNYQLFHVLCHLRVRQAVRALADLPHMLSPRTCAPVYSALNGIGDPAAIPPLKELLADTKERYIIRELEQLIDSLERKAATQG